MGVFIIADFLVDIFLIIKSILVNANAIFDFCNLKMWRNSHVPFWRFISKKYKCLFCIRVLSFSCFCNGGQNSTIYKSTNAYFVSGSPPSLVFIMGGQIILINFWTKHICDWIYFQFQILKTYFKGVYYEPVINSSQKLTTKLWIFYVALNFFSQYLST